MIEKDELLAIMPHRGRMLLLGRVTEYSPQDKCIIAEYDIGEDCPFYNRAVGGVPVFIGFEFIAQAAAAFAGLKNRGKNLKPGKGFILSVSSMECKLSLFKAGTTIKIIARETGSMGLVYSFEGKVLVKDRIALEGKITVMETD